MWSIRKTPERMKRIKTIADMIQENPANITKIIDYALSFTISANSNYPPPMPRPTWQDTKEFTIAQALTLADIAQDVAEKTFTGLQPTMQERMILYEQLTPMPPWYTDKHRETTMELITEIRKENYKKITED